MTTPGLPAFTSTVVCPSNPCFVTTQCYNSIHRESHARDPSRRDAGPPLSTTNATRRQLLSFHFYSNSSLKKKPTAVRRASPMESRRIEDSSSPAGSRLRNRICSGRAKQQQEKREMRSSGGGSEKGNMRSNGKPAEVTAQ